MMFKTPNLPEEKNTGESSEGKVSGFGGYSTRHEYEKQRKKKSGLLTAVQILVIVVLLALSCLGVIALVRGDFVPRQEDGKNATGSIKVPTQSELSESQRPPEEMLDEVALSLVTVEAEFSDGTFRYGTGFLVSDDGYAVCSSSVFAAEGEMQPLANITATTGDGLSVAVELKGVEEDLGIALLHLQGEFLYTPIPVENSFFVERGETLYAVASYKPKVFYGTVAKGIVSSVGPGIKAGKDGINANIIYLDLSPNETLYGSAVVDEKGAAVGFLTDAIPPLYGNLTPVIPINIVYTVINDLLIQG